TCRKHGAIIATSHEHSYSRTHLLSDFSTQHIANTSNTLALAPGQTFAFVSGLGGDSMRKWYKNLNENPWWAAAVSKSNKGNYGALLCTFNKDAIVGTGHCKFKDIDDKIWDDFYIESQQATAADGSDASGGGGVVGGLVYGHDREDVVVNRVSRVNKLVEVALSDATDIVSFDRVSGKLYCGGGNSLGTELLHLANSWTSSFWHIFRYKIPLAEFNAERGDTIKSARLQVMGAHSSRWIVGSSGGVKDSFSSEIIGIRIGAIAPNSNFLEAALACDEQEQGSLTRYRKTKHENGEVETSIGQQRGGRADVDDKLFEKLVVNYVDWTHEDEGWEAGEVWVSPDVGHIVIQGIAGKTGEVVLAIEGRTTGDNDLRAIHGQHERLGMCVSPTLLVEIEGDFGH
ncbi:hypothetical protein HK100_008026, partial [Physocladia obscura]